MQNILEREQVEAFYHDFFVSDQLRHFFELIDQQQIASQTVVDIGGGVGNFGLALKAKGISTKVIDMDEESVKQCLGRGLAAQYGDALAYNPLEGENIASFNLILHHLIGDTLASTRSLQSRSLSNWAVTGKVVFVNEYINESYIPRFAGVLIYLVTSSKFLSRIASVISKVVPSFRANTFGVGVRFRSNQEWVELFKESGFEVKALRYGSTEAVAMPLRLLLIKAISRDSFLLKPKSKVA